MNALPPSPLAPWTAADGTPLWLKRDDLLPFPAAGNKVRKLYHELQGVDLTDRVLVTVGSVTSNHCRTSAMMAAMGGGRAHLVLHGDTTASAGQRVALSLLESMGATYDVVEPSAIAACVHQRLLDLKDRAHFVYGGCHTEGGVRAYMAAVQELASQVGSAPDWIVHASGTGATQAGLVAGVREAGWKTKVLGVSVARGRERATAAIREALEWVGHGGAEVLVDDTHLAGGYGQHDSRVRAAVADGWRRGVPLDHTYTGKAMAGLLSHLENGSVGGDVVFWHTGGLMTEVAHVIDRPAGGSHA